MSYTIVRPGGMERPKDDYKETHNLVLKPRDSIFGGQVGWQRGIGHRQGTANTLGRQQGSWDSRYEFTWQRATRLLCIANHVT